MANEPNVNRNPVEFSRKIPNLDALIDFFTHKAKRYDAYYLIIF